MFYTACPSDVLCIAVYTVYSCIGYTLQYKHTLVVNAKVYYNIVAASVIRQTAAVGRFVKMPLERV